MVMKNVVKLIRKSLLNIPTPTSISYFWNFGSLLGVCLLIQILSGMFLSFHYSSGGWDSFLSVEKIMLDVKLGWLLRLVHANGASLFFGCLYFHIGKGIYYASFKFTATWLVGFILFVGFMGTAFLGYVLPWGQMSYWGATVITNLISTIPYVGTAIVEWVWGGFSVGAPTLSRFYSLHFILPFLLSVVVFGHLMSLHVHGSGNPLGVSLNSDKVAFGWLFISKDILGMFIMLTGFGFIVLCFPDLFLDPDNSMMANPMVTPPHIQPEWYFLFAYAILRSIPSKLGGVVGLLMSILIIGLLSLSRKPISVRFQPWGKGLFWSQISNFLSLTFIGALPVEQPFILCGQLVSFLYFLVFSIFILGV